MLHDVIIMNGMILLIYIISSASVTFLCHSNNSGDSSSNASTWTLDGVFFVVFPLSEP